MASFPSRTSRTHLIEDLKVGEKGTIAGRVIFSNLIRKHPHRNIADSSRAICCESADSGFAALPEGVILEATGERLQKDFFRVDHYHVLVSPQRYQSEPTPQMPNWQRATIDSLTRAIIYKRARVLRIVREFFYSRDFDEVETPIVVNVPGMEPYLNPFKTQLETTKGDTYPAYLITSPEYAMKKMLVAGMGKIFQITHSFRNQEELSAQHNPEFAILEWYRSYASYLDIMQDTEALIAEVARRFYWGDERSGIHRYQGELIDFNPPWPRIRYEEALREFAGLAYDEIASLEGLKSAMRQKGYTVESEDWDTLITQVFLNEVEPKLGRDKPCILYDYPVSQAALAKRSESDPRFAERFEVFIAGIELANAFTELNDPEEQLRRLQEEQALRRKLGKESYDIDQSFIEALRWGMPPSGGIALGIDRLLMILLNKKSVPEVIWQPWGEMFGSESN